MLLSTAQLLCNWVNKWENVELLYVNNNNCFVAVQLSPVFCNGNDTVRTKLGKIAAMILQDKASVVCDCAPVCIL